MQTYRCIAFLCLRRAQTLAASQDHHKSVQKGADCLHRLQLPACNTPVWSMWFSTQIKMECCMQGPTGISPVLKVTHSNCHYGLPVTSPQATSGAWTALWPPIFWHHHFVGDCGSLTAGGSYGTGCNCTVRPMLSFQQTLAVLWLNIMKISVKPW